jgi:hypothetical protein
MSGRPGRPSKMTEETKKKLEQALIGCCTIADACAYADISERTYEVWAAQAREDEAAGRDTQYVRFMRDIARAKAKAKPRLIMLLSKAAERDPRTTLAILERRYPNEWGARQYVETRDRTGEPEPKDEDVLPAVLEILDEFPQAKAKLTKKLEELR